MIFTVYNGIDTNDNLNNISINDVVKKYSIPSFNRYIAMVARLHPIKGHKDFLEALEMIHNKIKNIGI
ncbi:MAG: hypothetical protein RR645_01580 [Clostridium sp.]